MIAEKIELAKKIKNYYKEHLKNYLKDQTQEIEKILSKHLEEYSCNYKLLLNNSVYDKIPLFEITSRVKSEDSLYYKLIDKNKVFDFPSEDNLYSSKNQNIDSKILEIKDLIGIKILTNLSCDCDKVFKLLKEKQNESVKIDFSKKMPEIMKNGLEIYKTEATYKIEDKSLNFELQIKSKFDSSWGDLEHNLFYKDYDYYHLKENNHKLMIEIGKNLKNLENMMKTIRDSKTDFSINSDLNNFKEKINNIFSEQYTVFFGNLKFIEDNIKRLYFLYKHYNIDLKSNDKLKEYFDENYDNSEILMSNYISMKNKDLKVCSLENIFMNSSISGNDKVKIEKFIKGNLFFNFEQLKEKKEKENNQIEILINDEIEIIYNIFKASNFSFENSNLLFSVSNLEYFFDLKNKINDLLLNDEEVTEDILNEYYKIIFIKVFSFSKIKINENILDIDNVKEIFKNISEENMNNNELNTLVGGIINDLQSI